MTSPHAGGCRSMQVRSASYIAVATPMDQPIQKTQHVANPELTVVSVTPSTATLVDEEISLKVGNRKVVIDHFFDTGVTNEPKKYAQTVFVRLNSRKKLRFEKVSFQHCVFEGCYINNCSFDTAILLVPDSLDLIFINLHLPNASLITRHSSERRSMMTF
jgi:hypothetical protein